jgi:anti-anti-sigma factor
MVDRFFHWRKQVKGLDMEVTLEWREDKILVAWMNGDLDAANQETIRTEFARMVSQTPHGVVLNFSKARYVSSLGIGMIIELMRDLQKIGADLRITGVDSRVRLILDTAAVTRLIPLEPNLETALHHLRKHIPVVSTN